MDGAQCVPNPDQQGGILYFTKAVASKELTTYMGELFNQGHAVWVGTGSADQDNPTHFTKHTITLNHVLSMFKDPSKHPELKRVWASLDAGRRQQLTNQIKTLQPTASATPQAGTTLQLSPLESTAFVNILYNMPADQRHAFFADMDPEAVASIRKLIARSRS